MQPKERATWSHRKPSKGGVQFRRPLRVPTPREREANLSDDPFGLLAVSARGSASIETQSHADNRQSTSTVTTTDYADEFDDSEQEDEDEHSAYGDSSASR